MTQSVTNQKPIGAIERVAASGEQADIARLLTQLGAIGRIDVLHMLAAGKTDPAAIATELGIAPAAVRQHLHALAEVGIGNASKGNPTDAYKLVYHAVQLLNTAVTNPPVPAPAERNRLNGRDEIVPLVPQPPLACRVCENSGFVTGVLGELRNALTDTRVYHARIQEMSSQVLTAHEAERKRIARELHDDTAQAITSILVRLRLLERSTDSEKVLGNVEELRELASGALDSVRRMAMDLRPASLDDLGLVPALQSYADKYSQSWPVKVSVRVKGLKRRLPRDVELVLYRVIQEALTNAGKHSRARSVSVLLSRRSNHVELVIEDDGEGFDIYAARPNDGTGLGLFGMRERLALVGGVLEVCSIVGHGTKIKARVPLQGGQASRRMT